MIRFLLTILGIILIYSMPVLGKTGVESIIENDIAINGTDPSVIDSDVDESNVDINLSFSDMKDSIQDSLGVPEANYLVLILFSLAALLQMARVLSGSGNWVSFCIRVIVVLSFLQAYSVLFDGLELFFRHLSEQILADGSVADYFWAKQKMTIEQFSTALDDPVDSFNSGTLQSFFWMLLTGLSSISTYAFYTLIFLVQSCLLIALRYLGPIIIALAIIPETDFSSGFISTTIQTLSWSVLGAILIKIMGTTMNIGTNNALNFSDFVSVSAMNICYGLCFLMVPIMCSMIFSGGGLGSLALGVPSLGVKFMRTIRSGRGQ